MKLLQKIHLTLVKRIYQDTGGKFGNDINKAPIRRKTNMARPASSWCRNRHSIGRLQWLRFTGAKRIHRYPVGTQVLNEQKLLVGTKYRGMDMRRFLPIFIRAASFILYMLYIFRKTAVICCTKNTQAAP